MSEKKQSFFGKLFSKKAKKQEVDANKIVTPMQAILNNFKENKLAMGGLIGFILIVIFTFGGSMITPFNELYNEPILQNISPGKNFLSIPSQLTADNIKKIETGASFAFAIDKQGNLYHWGQEIEKVFKIPTELKNKKVEDIAVSDRHVVALTKDGEVFAWGANGANESTVPKSDMPRINAIGIKKVFAGPLYSGLLLENNSVVTWGANNVQQLDINPDLKGKIKDIYTLSENLIVLTTDGTVSVTGINILPQKTPIELTDGTVVVKKVVGSYRNALALLEDGTIRAWGAGGTGLEDAKSFNSKVVDIFAGYNNFTVLLENGEVHAWGEKAILGELNTPKDTFTKVYNKYFQSYGITKDGKIKAWGLKGFTLGSDELGRDILTRLIHGGKTSLLVGIVAVVISTIIGLIIGLISGFVGGAVDNILMRFAEVVASIPFLPLLITLSVLIGQSLDQNQRMYLVMVLIGLLSWVGLARLVRGQILIEREKDFVLAAKALGIKQSKIVLKHILPSVLSIAIVSMSLSYGGMMLTEAGLSFLGFGVMQPTPTWGNMLTGAQKAEVIQLYWWRWVFPALAVFVSVLAVNLVGDGIRDAVDPKANEK